MVERFSIALRPKQNDVYHDPEIPSTKKVRDAWHKAQWGIGWCADCRGARQSLSSAWHVRKHPQTGRWLCEGCFFDIPL